MGKEWYGVRKSSKRSVIVEGNETTPTPPSGCMCAFFQFFDFHPFHFPNTINHQQEITSSSCISKEHTTTSVPKGLIIFYSVFEVKLFKQVLLFNYLLCFFLCLFLPAF